MEIILGAQTFINSGTTGLDQPAALGEATWGVLTNLLAPPVDTAMRVRDALLQPHRFYRVTIELP